MFIAAFLLILTQHLAPVVPRMDNVIHWINLHPLNSVIGFPDTYLLDSDLSGGISAIQRLNNPGQINDKVKH